MNGETDIRHLDPVVLRQNLGWFIALGIALIILGAIAVALPLIATFAIERLVGILFIVGGIVFLIHAFRSRTWERSIAGFLISALYIVFGFALLAFPIGGVLTLTLFLATFFLIEGIFKIIQALRLRPVSNWGWNLFSGIVSFLLGVIIWAGLPMTALWTIGLIVGIDLIVGGISMLMIALSMRSALHQRRLYCIGRVCFQ